MDDAFDADELFAADDYLYFYAERLTDEHSDAEAQAIWTGAGLQPGMRVLDLACGHGRIANRLARAGADVTGLDSSAEFLEIARGDAQRMGVDVTYVEGDMRALRRDAEFDVVLNWFTAFGYFEDEDNRRVLDEVFLALRPGGRLVMELNHKDNLLTRLQSSVLVERDGDLMVDRSSYDPLTGRVRTERSVVREGRVRRFRFFVRLLSFTELRGWLRDTGFTSVQGLGEDWAPLTFSSRRMIVVAHK